MKQPEGWHASNIGFCCLLCGAIQKQMFYPGRPIARPRDLQKPNRCHGNRFLRSQNKRAFCRDKKGSSKFFRELQQIVQRYVCKRSWRQFVHRNFLAPKKVWRQYTTPTHPFRNATFGLAGLQAPQQKFAFKTPRGEQKNICC